MLPHQIDLMTLPEIGVLIENNKKRSIDPTEMSDEEYAKYWSSLTPKQRLLKVAEGKK